MHMEALVHAPPLDCRPGASHRPGGPQVHPCTEAPRAAQVTLRRPGERAPAASLARHRPTRKGRGGEGATCPRDESESHTVSVSAPSWAMLASSILPSRACPREEGESHTVSPSRLARAARANSNPPTRTYEGEPQMQWPGLQSARNRTYAAQASPKPPTRTYANAPPRRPRTAQASPKSTPPRARTPRAHRPHVPGTGI